MVRRLVDVAAQPHDGPLMLVGPSGSGKSSLLNAGFLATLRADGLPDVPGSSGWPVLRFTPGSAPLRRLAGQLGTDAETLRRDPAAARTCVDGLLADRPGQRLILLIDQFEELFTLCQDVAERAAFLQVLTALERRVLAILALRADFYGRAAEHPELVAALRDRQVLVEPMTSDELRAAIEGPAATAGLRLDAGLAEVILHELGAAEDGQSAMGALPLLSHVLWATWSNRTGSRLTVAGYRDAGGIAQAIATTADQVHTELDDHGRDAVRRMLPRLVRVGDDHDTAQPVETSTLLGSATDVTVAQRALHRLTEARLLTLDRDTTRISHEALLRHWPRLREWLDTDRDWLRGRQQLEEDARRWTRADRDPSLLYRGNRLAAMRQRAAQAPARVTDLPPACVEFMEAAEAQEHREIQRRRRGTALLAVLTVVAVIGGLVAVWQGERAAGQRDQLASSSVGQSADRVRETDPTLAMELALAAHGVADTAQARTSLLNSALTPYDTQLTGHAAEVGKLDYNPQRRLLASKDTQGNIRLWQSTDRRQPGTTAVIRAKEETDIALSPDGRLLAAGHTGRAQQLWDISDTAHPKVVAELLGGVGALAFSPDGRRLAVVTNEATLWDLSTPSRPQRQGTVALNTVRARDASFSSDGQLLAVALEHPPGDGSGDFQAGILDTTDPLRPTPVTTLPDTHALSVDFSPRGPLLAVSGTRGFDVWDLSDPAHPAPRNMASGSSPTNTIAFSAEGNAIAAGISSSSNGNYVVVLPVDGPRYARDEIARYPMQTKINSIAFGDATTQIFSSGADSAIHHWKDSEAARIPKAEGYQSSEDWSFTPRGDLLVLPAPGTESSGEFALFRRAPGQNPAPLSRIAASKDAVVRAVNDRTLLEVGSLGETWLWDVSNPARPVKGGALGIVHGSLGGEDFAGAGRTVAVHSSDQLVHLWDVTDPHQPVHAATVPGRAGDNDGLIEMSADGRTLYVLDQGSGTLQLWQVDEPHHPEKAGRITSEPRLSYLVGQIDSGPGRNRTLGILDINLNPREVELWNFNDLHKPIRGRTPKIAGNAFVVSNNGKTMAVPTPNTVELWDIGDVHRPAKLMSLPAADQSQITFSPDDRLLVSSADPGPGYTDDPKTEMHVWNVSDPRNTTEVGTPTLPGELVGIDFSPDGQLLLSTNPNTSQGAVYLLDPDVDHLTQRLCEATTGDLAAEHWNRYFPGVPERSQCD